MKITIKHIRTLLTLVVFGLFMYILFIGNKNPSNLPTEPLVLRVKPCTSTKSDKMCRRKRE
jgi:hypothetical protein